MADGAPAAEKKPMVGGVKWFGDIRKPLTKSYGEFLDEEGTPFQDAVKYAFGSDTGVASAVNAFVGTAVSAAERSIGAFGTVRKFAGGLLFNNEFGILPNHSRNLIARYIQQVEKAAGPKSLTLDSLRNVRVGAGLVTGYIELPLQTDFGIGGAWRKRVDNEILSLKTPTAEDREKAIIRIAEDYAINLVDLQSPSLKRMITGNTSTPDLSAYQALNGRRRQVAAVIFDILTKTTGNTSMLLDVEAERPERTKKSITLLHNMINGKNCVQTALDGVSAKVDFSKLQETDLFAGQNAKAGKNQMLGGLVRSNHHLVNSLRYLTNPSNGTALHLDLSTDLAKFRLDLGLNPAGTEFINPAGKGPANYFHTNVFPNIWASTEGAKALTYLNANFGNEQLKYAIVRAIENSLYPLFLKAVGLPALNKQYHGAEDMGGRIVTTYQTGRYAGPFAYEATATKAGKIQEMYVIDDLAELPPQIAAKFSKMLIKGFGFNRKVDNRNIGTPNTTQKLREMAGIAPNKDRGPDDIKSLAALLKDIVEIEEAISQALTARRPRARDRLANLTLMLDEIKGVTRKFLASTITESLPVARSGSKLRINNAQFNAAIRVLVGPAAPILNNLDPTLTDVKNPDASRFSYQIQQLRQSLGSDLTDFDPYLTHLSKILGLPIEALKGEPSAAMKLNLQRGGKTPETLAVISSNISRHVGIGVTEVEQFKDFWKVISNPKGISGNPDVDFKRQVLDHLSPDQANALTTGVISILTFSTTASQNAAKLFSGSDSTAFADLNNATNDSTLTAAQKLAAVFGIFADTTWPGFANKFLNANANPEVTTYRSQTVRSKLLDLMIVDAPQPGTVSEGSLAAFNRTLDEVARQPDSPATPTELLAKKSAYIQFIGAATKAFTGTDVIENGINMLRKYGDDLFIIEALNEYLTLTLTSNEAVALIEPYRSIITSPHAYQRSLVLSAPGKNFLDLINSPEYTSLANAVNAKTVIPVDVQTALAAFKGSFSDADIQKVREYLNTHRDIGGRIDTFKLVAKTFIAATPGILPATVRDLDKIAHGLEDVGVLLEDMLRVYAAASS